MKSPPANTWALTHMHLNNTYTYKNTATTNNTDIYSVRKMSAATMAPSWSSVPKPRWPLWAWACRSLPPDQVKKAMKGPSMQDRATLTAYAYHYKSEEGEAIRGQMKEKGVKREDFFIVSKV